MVNDRDIMVNSAKCRRAVCLSSCEAEVRCCYHILCVISRMCAKLFKTFDISLFPEWLMDGNESVTLCDSRRIKVFV